MLLCSTDVGLRLTAKPLIGARTEPKIFPMKAAYDGTHIQPDTTVSLELILVVVELEDLVN